MMRSSSDPAFAFGESAGCSSLLPAVFLMYTFATSLSRTRALASAQPFCRRRRPYCTVSAVFCCTSLKHCFCMPEACCWPPPVSRELQMFMRFWLSAATCLESSSFFRRSTNSEPLVFCSIRSRLLCFSLSSSCACCACRSLRCAMSSSLRFHCSSQACKCTRFRSLMSSALAVKLLSPSKTSKEATCLLLGRLPTAGRGLPALGGC
mmetsp:Transcript_66757/g.198653  ORF Transcript_66757/g.198653 Transcript_66757/m.198653 type:complete len:207 (+) Transcript_66757:1568-2188(+)